MKRYSSGWFCSKRARKGGFRILPTHLICLPLGWLGIFVVFACFTALAYDSEISTRNEFKKKMSDGTYFADLDSSSAKNDADVTKLQEDLLRDLKATYDMELPNARNWIDTEKSMIVDDSKREQENAKHRKNMVEWKIYLEALPGQYRMACDEVRSHANKRREEIRRQAEEERLEQERIKRQEAEEKRRQEQEDARKKHDQPDNPDNKPTPDNSNPAPEPTPEPPTPPPAPQNDGASFFPTPPPADGNGNNPPARKPAKRPAANPFADLWQPINQSALTNLTGLPPWTYPTNMPIWDPAPPHNAGAKRQPLAYAQLDKATRMEFSLLDIRMRTLGEHWDATTGAALLTAIKKFNLAHPDYPRGWQMQAQLALYLKQNLEQKIAAKNLIELGIKN